MSDFEDRVNAATKADDAAAIAALAAEASSKQEAKAVKRAIYLLAQRGVAVPEEPVKSKDAPGQSLGAATLPVLMGRPEPDDTRLFTLARQDSTGVLVVEARFRMPWGLERLQGSRSTRGQYLPWAEGLCARDRRRPESLPQRVRVDGRLLGRKLWEIRRAVEEGRLSPDVDRDLAARLTRGVHMEPHPAAAASGGRRLSMAQLAEREHRLAAFFHREPQERIRAQWAERGGAAIGSAGPGSIARRAAAEWAEEWGPDRVRETMLDVAAYCAALRDPDGARTLAEAAADPAGFLQDYVVHLLG